MDDLAHALALGGQMLVAAEAGDWDRVATLQEACDACLRRAPGADAQARPTLLELQRQYRELGVLAGQARSAVAGELERHRHSHRALHAYLDSSGR